MREAKEEQLKIRANAIERAKAPKSSISRTNKMNMDDITAARGGYTNPL